MTKYFDCTFNYTPFARREASSRRKRRTAGTLYPFLLVSLPFFVGALHSGACEICDSSNIYITVLDIERIQRSPLIDSECAILLTISEEVRFKDEGRKGGRGGKNYKVHARANAGSFAYCYRAHGTERSPNNRARESRLRITRVARISTTM